MILYYPNVFICFVIDGQLLHYTYHAVETDKAKSKNVKTQKSGVIDELCAIM